ncbi:hypothetical protein B0H16DRAFT_1451524 [Mycena metata]|uniref:Uncharacterized protein n=1 Tax=Mycena metata TaxID=1033252 RepID=A0AAD7JV79_9AGAR|nr:hypothetical protein B0H16DRAFT_1451524 [Mycena metata]
MRCSSSLSLYHHIPEPAAQALESTLAALSPTGSESPLKLRDSTAHGGQDDGMWQDFKLPNAQYRASNFNSGASVNNAHQPKLLSVALPVRAVLDTKEEPAMTTRRRSATLCDGADEASSSMLRGLKPQDQGGTRRLFATAKNVQERPSRSRDSKRLKIVSNSQRNPRPPMPYLIPQGPSTALH